MPKGQEKVSSKTVQDVRPENIKDAKDISNILNILDIRTLRTDPFGANVTGFNCYRRGERIVAALYLVTNHVPNEEPLRISIRQNGLRVLDSLLELRSGFRAQSSERGQEIIALLREIISLVRMLTVVGYISTDNGQAIIDALDELGVLITTSQRSSLAEQLTIARKDLVPPAQESSIWDGPISSRSRVPRATPRPQRDGGGASSARADQIMDILKAGGMLGIKDIAANVPQYSEKMVQRELGMLVVAGRVEKVGEKRWSKYRVVS